MYYRKHFLSGGISRHEPSAITGFMRHFPVRVALSSVCLTMVGLCLTLSAQTKKPSVWDKIKQAAQQPGQQQPQQPGQRPQRPAQQPSSGSSINDSGAFKPPAGTKIEEKILAPLQDRAKFEVSPHGVHVTTTETDGSRAVVYYDGVEAPKFDEILPAVGGAVSFSADGKRHACWARSGAQPVL